jgi:hypothetical protein
MVGSWLRLEANGDSSGVKSIYVFPFGYVIRADDINGASSAISLDVRPNGFPFEQGSEFLMQSLFLVWRGVLVLSPIPVVVSPLDTAKGFSRHLVAFYAFGSLVVSCTAFKLMPAGKAFFYPQELGGFIV